MLIFSYEEDGEDFEWEDFKENVENELFHKSNLDLPFILEARNSNWRGQTGYAKADTIDEMFNKLCSFGSSFIELHKENDEYYFKLATHDVPTGFCVYIKQEDDDE
jgi:hypothetical protein